MLNSAAQVNELMQVAAGAVRDARGRVLIAKRPDGVHQGGLWEFPGGKLQLGESPQDGLARELLEELGIRIRAWRPLIRLQHDYGDRHVVLHVYRIDAYDGIASGQEGQPLAWVKPDAMDPALFPAADRQIINALRLPTLYLITGQNPQSTDSFFVRLRRALAIGTRLVQLRAHGVDDLTYARLVRRAYPLCHAADARLILNRDPKLVEQLPCDGLHLRSDLLRRLRGRPCTHERLVGASCHNAQELRMAEQLNLDYALLSPVQPTSTHPEANSLGWRGFAELARAARLPVYALGGMKPEHRDQAIELGGQGVAAIRGIWPDASENSML